MSRSLLRTVRATVLASCAGLGAVCFAAEAAPTVSSTSGSGAAAAALDLPGYIRTLEQLRSAVAGLSTHPQNAAALRGSLPKSWTVEVSGQRFEVAAEWLGGELTRMESNPAQGASAEKEALARLDRLRAEAAALLAPPDPDPAAARAALQEILSRREYASVHTPSWFELAWARFIRALERLLERIFGTVAGSVTTRRILSWLLIGGSFVLLVVLLVRWLLRAIRRTELALVAPAAASKHWRQWAQEALAAGACGEFRAAVQACYWAGIGRLEDLGVWTADPSHTPREYLRLLAKLGTEVSLPGRATGFREEPALEPERLRGALGPLTGTFERVWYAGEGATAADFHASLDRLEELGCRFPSNRPTAAS